MRSSLCSVLPTTAWYRRLAFVATWIVVHGSPTPTPPRLRAHSPSLPWNATTSISSTVHNTTAHNITAGPTWPTWPMLPDLGPLGSGSARCRHEYNSRSHCYTVWLYDWTYDSYCRGLLDNLHGAAGWVDGWVCYQDLAYPQDNIARFVVDFGNVQNVEDAIFMASYNRVHVPCIVDPSWGGAVLKLGDDDDDDDDDDAVDVKHATS